jgi:hypothetical protein
MVIPTITIKTAAMIKTLPDFFFVTSCSISLFYLSFITLFAYRHKSVSKTLLQKVIWSGSGQIEG